MSRTTWQIDSIQRTVQKTEEWLDDLAGELGTDDGRYAWRVLRAYLRVLRERLTPDESAQLAAQLTHLLRGVFYEGFDPGREPHRLRTRDEFLQRLAERAQLPEGVDPAVVAALATRVLRRRLTAGEVDDILFQLPTEICDVLVHG